MTPSKEFNREEKWERARSYVARTFVLDTRSVGLFRIFFGAVITADLLSRLEFFGAFYTEAGVLPVDLLYEEFGREKNFLLDLSRNESVMILLFAVMIPSSVLYGLGVFPNYLAAVLFVAFFLLNQKNPYILNSSSDLIQAFLFWSIFLPLEAKFSLTKRRQKSETSFLEPVNLCLFAQFVMIYFFAALHKNVHLWRGSGLAMEMVLKMDTFVDGNALTRWLLQFPGFLRLAAKLIFLLQLIGPYLLLLPMKRGYFRCAVVSAFMLFHLSIALILGIGVFPFASITTWMLLIPPVCWNRLPKAP